MEVVAGGIVTFPFSRDSTESISVAPVSLPDLLTYGGISRQSHHFCLEISQTLQ
jgi:hypothetical protein